MCFVWQMWLQTMYLAPHFSILDISFEPWHILEPLVREKSFLLLGFGLAFFEVVEHQNSS